MERIQSHQDYLRCYQQAWDDPEIFWSKIGDNFQWVQKYTQAAPDLTLGFNQAHWFKDGVPVSYTHLTLPTSDLV